jgi:hypothetical protein
LGFDVGWVITRSKIENSNVKAGRTVGETPTTIVAKVREKNIKEMLNYLSSLGVTSVLDLHKIIDQEKLHEFLKKKNPR